MQYLVVSILIILIYFIFIQKSGKKKEIDKTNWFKEKDENFNFYLIGKYFQSRINIDKYFHLISDKVSIDLDLDGIFKKIDKTSSKIGQQYLYAKIRTIKNSISELDKFSKLVNFFINNEVERNLCIKRLSYLNSDNSYYFEELFNDDLITNKKIAKICIYLNITFVVFIILTVIQPIFFLGLIPLFCANMFLHYRNKGLVSFNLNKISEFSKTLNVAEKISKSNNFYHDHFENLKFLKPLLFFNKKINFFLLENSLNNDILIPIWLFFEFLKVTFNIEVILYNSLLNDINKYKTEMNDLFKFIGEIDASISVVGLQLSEINVCKPKFIKGKYINVENLYHPLISECVLNSLELNEKSLLLTGSNMSGKTTFIRAFAINSIYSQSLNISFSKNYESPFLKIFSSIRTQDDIHKNKSFYLDEVLTIKDFIESINPEEAHLFILDEIFKGTNTLERIAIGKSVLSFLNRGNNFVFVSTHDLELADLLINSDFDLYHFSEDVTNNSLTFNYKLKEGKLQTRNAIKILTIYEYPKEIIEEANEIYNNSITQKQSIC
jgi:hypothetical protein